MTSVKKMDASAFQSSASQTPIRNDDDSRRDRDEAASHESRSKMSLKSQDDNETIK